MSNLVRALSEDGGIIVTALDSTNIVREMERVHKPSAVVAAALGRLLTGGALMGSGLKNDEDTLTLRVNGGGPAGTLLVVSDSAGNVRGYAEHNVVELPIREDGKLDVGTAVGRQGTLAVIRDMGTGEPYVGAVPLVSGEIAEDITSYYASSEQVPTVCALGVMVDTDLSILCAGGFLLQCLPGVDEATIQIIENNLSKMDSVTDLLKNGKTPEDIIDSIMAGLSPQILDGWQVEYKCRCSYEKTHDIIQSLGAAELQKMKQESATATVQCHFCDKKYTFDLDEEIAAIKP